MILIPYSYNGTLLQSSDYDTSFPKQQAASQIMSNPGYIKRAGAVPVFAGKDLSPHVLNLEILCQGDFMAQPLEKVHPRAPLNVDRHIAVRAREVVVCQRVRAGLQAQPPRADG